MWIIFKCTKFKYSIITIKAFKEAEEHKGPSIIIAYAPCIEQGIKKGMACAQEEQKLAVECGYTLLMRYNGEKLTIDSKEPNYEKYEEFLDGEVRYNSLRIKNPDLANVLLTINKENAIDRYNYYKNLVTNDKNVSNTVWLTSDKNVSNTDWQFRVGSL